MFVGMAGTQKAIVSHHVGKRDTENADLFIRDLRERVLGLPEIRRTASIRTATRYATLSATAFRTASSARPIARPGWGRRRRPTATAQLQ